MKQGEGFVIFCEDIREEKSGQSSIIGLFQEDIILNEPFPVRIPKFSASINIYVDAANPPKKLVISLFSSWDVKPLIEIEQDLDLPLASDDYRSRYGKDELSRFEGEVPRLLVANLVAPMLPVQQEGLIRIVGELDGERYILGRKYIRSIA